MATPARIEVPALLLAALAFLPGALLVYVLSKPRSEPEVVPVLEAPELVGLPETLEHIEELLARAEQMQDTEPGLPALVGGGAGIQAGASAQGQVDVGDLVARLDSDYDGLMDEYFGLSTRELYGRLGRPARVSVNDGGLLWIYETGPETSELAVVLTEGYVTSIWLM